MIYLLAVPVVVSIYGLGTLSGSVPRWCAIYAFAGAALVWFTVAKYRLDNIDRLALCLFGWAAVSLLWSLDWRAGAYQLVNAGALLSVFLWVRHAPEKAVSCLSPAALIALLSAFVLQDLNPLSWGGHGNRNLQSEAMIILAMILATGWWVSVIPALGVFAYLMYFNPSKVEFAVIAVLAIVYVYQKLRRVPDRPA